MAIEMKVETVTPEIAAKYLKRNVDNYRKISKARAMIYAEEMKAGKWQLNGEPVVFGANGVLKDGQHRLAAVMMSGTPVKMTIITGVDDDVNIFNNGMNRSTKQMAAASGMNDITSTEAATATVIVGNFDSKVPRGKVLDYIQRHYAEINRAYRVCGAQGKKLSKRVGCVLATDMMLRMQDAKSYDLEVFFSIFNSGNVIGADGYDVSSALVARRIFEERYKGNASNKRTLMEQCEIILMAVSDFIRGKKRQMNYQIREPMTCASLMKRMRKEDGLEE